MFEDDEKSAEMQLIVTQATPPASPIGGLLAPFSSEPTPSDASIRNLRQLMQQTNEQVRMLISGMDQQSQQIAMLSERIDTVNTKDTVNEPTTKYGSEQRNILERDVRYLSTQVFDRNSTTDVFFQKRVSGASDKAAQALQIAKLNQESIVSLASNQRLHFTSPPRNINVSQADSG